MWGDARHGARAALGGSVVTSMRWTASTRWFLDETYLMLEPDAAGGWFIIDVRQPDRSVGRALDLKQAKRRAVQLLDARPDLMK